MSRGKDRYFSSLDFFLMSIFYFVVCRHEQPAVFVAKPNNFRVFYIPPNLSIFIFEPFGKSRNGKPRRPQANSHGFG